MRLNRGSVTRLVLWLSVALCGRAAWAAPSCAIPADPGVPHAEGPRAGETARTVPIGGYTLATVWMPQHCKQAVRGIQAVECTRPGVRAAGLTLHGLWPDGEGREWPQWCRPAALLSTATIAAHYCATPSAQLMQHEWAKHGTCLPGYTPERYFDRAESLYRAIHVPDLRALSYQPQTVASVKRAIADANPGLRPDSMTLNLDRRGWLEEVWFCLDTRFAARACAAGRPERPEAKVLIWRGGRQGGDRDAYRRD